MSYPGVRRAAKRTELDRGTWADRANFLVTYDFVAPGTFVTENIVFGEVFEGFPDFSYGVELIEGQTLLAGDFPMVNAGVALWDQTFPEGSQLPRVMGASLFLAVYCSTAYRLRFRFSFNGVAFANPTLLGTPTTL